MLLDLMMDIQGGIINMSATVLQLYIKLISRCFDLVA